MAKRGFISADIEGITGLVSWSQCSRPDGESFDYAFARRMMTHDVNAAIRGMREAKFDEIVVKDSHGNSKNLLIDELEDGVELVSGSGHPDRMMGGIDESFDLAVLIGYHAMAGTEKGVMEHTYTGRSHRLFINDLEVGEIVLAAMTASRYRVPIVAVTSDDAGCDEARRMLGCATFSVKRGLGRYAAQLKHPSLTGPGIQNLVKAACSNPGRPPYPLPDGEIRVRLEVNRTEDADYAAKLPGVHRLSGYVVQRVTQSPLEAHEWAHLLLEVGALGLSSQN